MKHEKVEWKKLKIAQPKLVKQCDQCIPRDVLKCQVEIFAQQNWLYPLELKFLYLENKKE